jgi:hypothetical protein
MVHTSRSDNTSNKLSSPATTRWPILSIYPFWHHEHVWSTSHAVTIRNIVFTTSCIMMTLLTYMHAGTGWHILLISHGPYSYYDLLIIQRPKETFHPSLMAPMPILTYLLCSEQKKYCIHLPWPIGIFWPTFHTATKRKILLTSCSI